MDSRRDDDQTKQNHIYILIWFIINCYLRIMNNVGRTIESMMGDIEQVDRSLGF